MHEEQPPLANEIYLPRLHKDVALHPNEGHSYLRRLEGSRCLHYCVAEPIEGGFLVP